MYEDTDDWRVEAELADAESAKGFHDALATVGARGHDGGARDDAPAPASGRELGRRTIVTRDEQRVFAYARTRVDAEAAQEALRQLAQERRLEASFRLAHWNLEAEAWEDPGQAPSSDPAALAAQGHAAEQATEREEGQASRIPEFEVRLTLPSHRDATELAQRLAAEGIPTQRHWRYLLIGAWTEDDANALAQRLRGELGDAAQVGVELTQAYVYHGASVFLAPPF